MPGGPGRADLGGGDRLRGRGADPRVALAAGGPLVVAEPTANRLVPAHKGAHWMRLTARGRAAHGSAPELGDNAVVRLARAAVALHDFDGWPIQDGFGRVTANVGLMRGGVQPNVVPDAAELLLDVRTVPSASGDAVRDLVRSLAGEGVEVGRPRGAAAGRHRRSTTASSPSWARRWPATGLDGSPAEPARYFTDASALIPLLTRAGERPAPTVVLGPGEPDQCHVADEWCSLERVDRSVEVYAELLHRWCG